MLNLVIGDKYKWKHETKTLVYVGKCGVWNQFSLPSTNELWCEVLDSDLYLMERCNASD